MFMSIDRWQKKECFFHFDPNPRVATPIKNKFTDLRSSTYKNKDDGTMSIQYASRNIELLS